MTIPRILHFIWVGDQSIRPDNCIDTWRTHHPDWDIRVWGNEELDELAWVNRDHMAAMYGEELNGVADMMRWEILHADGGIVVDADSICLRPLDDMLLDCEAFACWENEIARPGLIAAGYFGCCAGNPFVKRIIDDIAAMPSVVEEMAWITVGPQRLTDSYRKYAYSQLRIYPSHYFIPAHFTGLTYKGADPVYAHQFWGSTRGIYEELHARDVSADVVAPKAPPLPAAAPLETSHAPHLIQRVAVSSEIAQLPRADVFRHMCTGKRVLHVGDGDPAALAPACATLDICAADAAPAPGTGYDLVLVPAAMDCVPNVQEFLTRLEAIDAPCFLIAVPDAWQCRAQNFDYRADSQTFVEAVHPDRNAWYTPYTFANTIRKYSALTVERMWFFDGDSLLALVSRQELRLAA